MRTVEMNCFPAMKVILVLRNRPSMSNYYFSRKETIPQKPPETTPFWNMFKAVRKFC